MNKYWRMFENAYTIILHVSQFAGYIIPLADFVLPIVMWVTNKEKSKTIDQQGKYIVNWLISSIIYLIIFGALSFILIGLPFLVILGILALIFPFIGAIKAANGEAWKYPLSINFIS